MTLWIIIKQCPEWGVCVGQVYKNGRRIPDVMLPDGTNVNHTLVKDGWCWWYRKYAPGNSELEKLEKDAREAKKGLWVDPAPIPPWVYRKARRR